MFELVKAGGLLMWPLLICSILSLAIILERLWFLRTRRVIPTQLVARVRAWDEAGALDANILDKLRAGSPLGRILAAGLANRHQDRDVMKESIEEVGRHEVHDLERFLNALGTIAVITPLLGLLGTVIGMIKVFEVITALGIGDPGVLAAGISEALITTATGLTIAIPSLMFYRYFRGRVEALVVTMEREALKLIEATHGEQG